MQTQNKDKHMSNKQQSDISIHDLKCGNILNYHTSEGDVLPTIIDWHDLKWLTEDPEGFNLVHSPIPLTEEWLADFNFENTYRSEFRLKFDHITHQEIGFDFSCVGYKSMEGFRFYGHYIKIQCVHQLQNLFYCLTGVMLSGSNLARHSPCDVCGSDEVIESPHMGSNCNRCHPIIGK